MNKKQQIRNNVSFLPLWGAGGFFRYLTRDKAFSYINLTGLAVGFTAVLYIGCFIARETSYDNFHEHGADIYRVAVAATMGDRGGEENYVMTPPVGPAMKALIPEVAEYARIATPRTYYLSYRNEFFKTGHVVFADTSFFRFFSFPLLKGDAATVLSAPYSIVLTEDLAATLFGSEEPVGKILQMDGQDYSVTGVAATPPPNTEIPFRALASFSTLYRMPDRQMDWNGGNQYITYVRLSSGTEVQAAAGKLDDLLQAQFGAEYAAAGITLKPFLRPLRELHLHYSYTSAYLRITLYVLSAIALLIVVIAGVNFFNLTTARSLKRIKEAGVRKALGARRADLVRRFLGESLLVSLTAFLMALVLFKLLEPVYQHFTGSPLALDAHSLPAFLAVLCLAVVVGAVGGSYPAVRLSSIPMHDVAKGGGDRKRRKHRLQNILITLQLVISVVLIISTAVVSFQLSYIQNKDVGFNREGILLLSLTGKAEQAAAERLKQRLAAVPGVAAVALSSEAPCGDFTQNGYRLQGAEKPQMLHVVEVDADFLQVYNIPLLSGRFFSKEREADRQACLVNEKLARLLGGNEEAIGKKIARNGWNEVIGVVKDFHYATLYSDIQPLVITCRPEAGHFSCVSVKYAAGDLPALLQAMEAAWKAVTAGSPFDYAFFDERYAQQYELERYFRDFFLCFAVIAILLSVVGMLNLMACTTEQRKKEIGIRKVLGASVPDILALLLRETGWQVVIANVVAWPLAWYAAQLWLNNFVYRIPVSWPVFALAFLASAVIVLSAVGVLAYRAATANPVEAIQAE